MCFCWLGFLFPNCSVDGQKPLEAPVNSLSRVESLGGKGLLMVWASLPPSLSPTRGAWQSSLRKMFIIGRYTVPAFLGTAPVPRKWRWSAPRNFAIYRVSPHLSLAQQVQEALSITRDIKLHRRPKRWKFVSKALWALAVKIGSPFLRTIFAMWTCILFLFNFVTSSWWHLPVAFTHCWRRNPNVSAGILGEVFMKPQYIQGELSTTKEGFKLSRVHLSFRESRNATHH